MADKLDQGKCRVDLIDPEFITGIGDVLTMGAIKYAEDSWKQVDNAQNRYYGALLRHLLAWRNGETTDPESNMPHMHHVACNAMFLQHFTREAQHENRSNMGDAESGGSMPNGGQADDEAASGRNRPYCAYIDGKV